MKNGELAVSGTPHCWLRVIDISTLFLFLYGIRNSWAVAMVETKRKMDIR